MSITTIEWTDRTWNPIRGCSRVSPGCVKCYAERQALRFAGVGSETRGGPFAGFVHKVNGHAAWTGKVELIESKLEEPLRWRKPCRVFVNSMSDLFHESLPYEDKRRVLEVIRHSDWHTHQVLTKRPAVMLQTMKRYYEEYADSIGPDPLPNLWLGVSVESRAYLGRIDVLRETPVAIRFVSIEPLLENLDGPNLRGLDWVIVGGESGPGARPFHIDWARFILSHCRRVGVAPFLKQLGSNPVWGHDNQKLHLTDSHGGDPSEWPEDMRDYREFPR